ncbi:GntR family transcriptional regulator [Cupriavidus necator]|nr:GntR family transcriptional regulator [Cupriavidus necator]
MLSGQLQAGQSLPSERELMSMFAVGRSSVREALYYCNGWA